MRRKLALADLVSYQWPVLTEPPAPKEFGVVYEDDDLLVVDKPALLPCHPGGRYFRHTLWWLLQEQAGQAMHGAGLRFHHPGNQRWMEFSSPLPAEMARLVG